MKKIIIVFALLLASVVNADYLYWMVDSESSSGFNWSEARLVQAENHQIGTLTKDQASDLEGIGYTYAKLYGNYGSDYSDTTSFFIELYNSSNEKVAEAKIGTYNSLKPYIFADNSTDVYSAAGFTPTLGSFQAVPEPTSGLLFLVGGMLLGLRRKRRV